MTSIKWNWQQVSRLWYKLHQKQLSTCTPLNLPQTLDTSHKREFGSIMLLFCNCGTEEASCFCGKGCTDKKKEKQNAVQIHIWIPWGHIILTFYVPHRQVILCFFNSFAEQVLGGGSHSFESCTLVCKHGVYSGHHAWAFLCMQRRKHTQDRSPAAAKVTAWPTVYSAWIFTRWGNVGKLNIFRLKFSGMRVHKWNMRAQNRLDELPSLHEWKQGSMPAWIR